MEDQNATQQDEGKHRPSIARDTLFSERVVWTGSPTAIEVTPVHRATVWVLAVVSVVTTLLAIAISQVIRQPAGAMIFFAAWCASFALAVRAVPVLWARSARYTITDKHVICRQGRFVRTIQRDGITFARIHWSKHTAGVGDLELVRAVPTGALRRRLTLSLEGIAAPDRVWAIVRGTPPGTDARGWTTPLEDRLELGEKCLWQSRPATTWRSWLPLRLKRTALLALGILAGMGAVRTILMATALAAKLMHAGLAPLSLAFASLFTAILVTVLLLTSLAVALAYLAIAASPLLDRHTMYLVTDRRVLLQRGRMEIHVDRGLIVDVIDHDGVYGEKDVHLVLDGPQSRAVATSGAFGRGEGMHGFLPVMHGVRDMQGLIQALDPKTRHRPSLVSKDTLNDERRER